MGAAQSIGWILTVDDTDLNTKLSSINTNVSNIKDAFGATLQDAIKPLVSMLEDIRDLGEEVVKGTETLADPDVWKDIAEQVGDIGTSTEKINDAVKDAFKESKKAGLTESNMRKFGESMGKKSKWLKQFVIDFVNAIVDIAKIVKFIVGLTRDFVLILYGVTSFLYKTFGPILKGFVKGAWAFIKMFDRVLSELVFGFVKLSIKGVRAVLNGVVNFATAATTDLLKNLALLAKKAIGVTFKLLTGMVKTSFSMAASLIVNLSKLAAKAITTAFGPVFWVANFLTSGIRKLLGPVFDIVNDFFGAIMFALEPLFMAFRLMIIPFVHMLLPIILDAVVKGMFILVEGAAWLWDNVLSTAFDWFLGTGKFRSWSSWWGDMVAGWKSIWEGSGLKALWQYISDGRGISGWWANMLGGWKIIWKDWGLEAFFGWFSDPKGIGKWWAQFKEGWLIIWDGLGLQDLWNEISSGNGIKGWWENMKAGWTVLWDKMGIGRLWTWLSDGKGIKGWWANMLGGWEVLKEHIATGLRWLANILITPVNWINKVFATIISLAGKALAKMGESLAYIPGMGPGESRKGGALSPAEKVAKAGYTLQGFGAAAAQPISFAAGGEVRKPTLAVLGDAGSELVIPVGGAAASSVATEGDAGVGGAVERFGGTNIADTVIALLTSIRDNLDMIAGNTMESSWINDPDFDGEQHKSFWES
jgi:hypothetical protein